MSETLSETVRLGVVGACRRGAFALHPPDGFRLHALCDINAEAMKARAVELPHAVETFTDFQQMLDESDLHAVVIATPMPLHVPMAIKALKRGIHVLSEVPAGVSVEECQRLVLACRESPAVYMLAENMNYFRAVQIVTAMVRAGLFGETYYAEGEYLHQIRGRFESTPWRRRWQVGINGVTYGTHSLGPILQWMPGDRVVSVSCVGAGRRHRDAKGELYETEAPCVMLCRMRSGGLVKILLDLISDGPACHKFRLQGTDGCLEIPDFDHDHARVWLRSRCEKEQWRPLADFADEFLPPTWREHGQRAANAGHDGSDYIQLLDFLNGIRTGKPVLDIHEAMDMTLPGLVSQQSIAEGGRWIDVPDSRAW